MAKEVDLKEIRLSARAEATWRSISKNVANTVRLIGMARAVDQPVPDAKARQNDDGTLTVFVKIPKIFGVYIQIPAGQWRCRK